MSWLTEIKQSEGFKDSLKSNTTYATASAESFSNKLQSNLSNNDDKEVKLMNLDDFFRGIGVNVDENNEDAEAVNPKSFDETMNSMFEYSPVDVQINAKSEAYYHLDHSSYHFAEDELKLQPMVRKSRKQLTPDEQKDARYWDKRAKNNFAAKRSRETRRMRENQIVLRANFLEKENGALKNVVKKLKEENDELRKLLNQ